MIDFINSIIGIVLAIIGVNAPASQPVSRPIAPIVVQIPTSTPSVSVPTKVVVKRKIADPMITPVITTQVPTATATNTELVQTVPPPVVETFPIPTTVEPVNTPIVTTVVTPTEQTITIEIVEPPAPKNILELSILPVSYPDPISKKRFIVFETSYIPTGMVENTQVSVSFSGDNFVDPGKLNIYGETLTKKEGIYSLSENNTRQLRGNVVFDTTYAKVTATTTATFTLSATPTCFKEYDSCVFPTFPVTNTITLVPF